MHACVQQEVRPLQTNGTSSSLILRPHLVSFSDLIWHTCHFQYIYSQDCTYSYACVWIGVDDCCCSQWALLLWQWLPSFGSMWRFYQVSSRNTICYCARCWSDLYSSEAQKPSCICRSLLSYSTCYIRPPFCCTLSTCMSLSTILLCPLYQCWKDAHVRPVSYSWRNPLDVHGGKTSVDFTVKLDWL